MYIYLEILKVAIKMYSFFSHGTSQILFFLFKIKIIIEDYPLGYCKL